MASIFWRTEDKRARTRRERERGEKRKEKRKKEPLCFSPFLFSGFVRASRHGERFSLLFFFFSLSHCETPQLGCRSRVSSLRLSLEISPDQATRQLPTPKLKEITPNAASCRCGRGEKRTKEDALLGASIFGTSCRNHRALSTPPQACCPFKTSSVAKNSICLSTTSKIRQREPRPLPSEPRKRRRGFGRHDIARSISPSSRFQTEEKQNARLRSRRRAEQDDPREQREHRRSELHGGGFEENLSKGRERRKEKEDEESVKDVQPTVQRPLSKPSTALALASSLFPFPRPTNLGGYLASSRYSKPAPGP